MKIIRGKTVHALVKDAQTSGGKWKITKGNVNIVFAACITSEME